MVTVCDAAVDFAFSTAKSTRLTVYVSVMPSAPRSKMKLSRQDLRTYVDVLAECVASWAPGDEHSLKVVFPSAARLQVAGLE
jgi:hypothetical protein